MNNIQEEDWENDSWAWYSGMADKDFAIGTNSERFREKDLNIDTPDPTQKRDTLENP